MLVVKYGGNAMGDGSDPFLAECAQLILAGTPLVLVHGGGPQIDRALRELGAGDERVAGLRVTDARTLEITERVLCASVNKALVRGFARLGVRAAGISGQDGGMLLARRMAPVAENGAPPRSLGFVGEIERVDPALVHALLRAGFTPVIAPLGVSVDAREYFNVNADTAAGAIAGALEADPYVVVTDVPRVRSDPRDPATGLDLLTLAQARRYREGGSFDGGMLPKIEAVFTALQTGARRAVIAGGAQALHKALAGDGTVIVP